MDIITLISLVLSFGALILAFVIDGGHVTALLEPTAALIVFGGTFGAVGVSIPKERLVKIPQMIKDVFFPEKENREAIMAIFLELANTARREGILALEQQLMEGNYDEFIVTGIQLVIDGSDPEGLEHTMETRIRTAEDRYEKEIAVFEAAGGFAPTMGVLGTVMGMVHVLGDMGAPSELGAKVAVAFLATLYGVASANLLWLPIAGKLKEIYSEKIMTKQMMLEGIRMLQNGSNPTFMREQLKGYLTDASKENQRKEG